MTRAIAYGAATLLLATIGCDPEGGEPDDGTQFRQTITYVQVQTQTSSFSAKGCDPDWWFIEEFGEKEWVAMIHTQSRMSGDEMLLRTFLANPESAELCHHACAEVDGRWTGNARVTDSEHEVGDTEIVGECPGKMLATSTPTESVGEIGCECG